MLLEQRRRLRVGEALHVDEAASSCRAAAGRARSRRRRGCRCAASATARGVADLLRVGEDRRRLLADRELHAGAVEDRAAARGRSSCVSRCCALRHLRERRGAARPAATTARASAPRRRATKTASSRRIRRLACLSRARSSRRGRRSRSSTDRRATSPSSRRALRLDPRRGERARELRLRAPRSRRAASCARCVALVEREVEPQHGHVHEDDAREQDRADRDPDDRRRARAAARFAARLRAARSSASAAAGAARRRRADGVATRLAKPSPPRAAAPTASAGCARPRPRDGRIARRGVARSAGCAPQTQTGKSGGHVQPCSCARRNRLTIRSSSEWNEITASRPPGRSISSAAGSARSSAPSSSLTSIRSAWKTRLAGWPSPKRAGAGIACLIVSTRSPVRSNGCLRAAADDRARDLPRVALLAVAAEDVGELALVGLVDDARARSARPTDPCACRAARRPRTRSRARAGRAASTRRRGRAGSRRRARRSRRAASSTVENSPCEQPRLRRRRRGAAARSTARRVGSRSIAISLPSPRSRAASSVGVAAGAERAVDHRLARARREGGEHLVREDGDVVSLGWQDARQHLLRSLRPRAAARASRRDPRSRGGRRRRRR